MIAEYCKCVRPGCTSLGRVIPVEKRFVCVVSGLEEDVYSGRVSMAAEDVPIRHVLPCCPACGLNASTVAERVMSKGTP